ncbi:transposase [Lysinibacillus sphaericus]|nr:transposase [Lysinibacillus sphaericus]
MGQKIFVQSLQKQITGFIFSSIIVGTSWSYYLSNGYPKITAILRQGRVVNHKAVQRIMQKYGWPCRVKV